MRSGTIWMRSIWMRFLDIWTKLGEIWIKSGEIWMRSQELWIDLTRFTLIWPVVWQKKELYFLSFLGCCEANTGRLNVSRALESPQGPCLCSHLSCLRVFCFSPSPTSSFSSHLWMRMNKNLPYPFNLTQCSFLTCLMPGCINTRHLGARHCVFWKVMSGANYESKILPHPIMRIPYWHKECQECSPRQCQFPPRTRVFGTRSIGFCP